MRDQSATSTEANHYDVLGVSRGASADEIRAAWRTAARRLHPDRGGSAAAFGRAHAAYEILGNEESRSFYDEYLRVVEMADRAQGAYERAKTRSEEEAENQARAREEQARAWEKSNEDYARRNRAQAEQGYTRVRARAKEARSGAGTTGTAKRPFRVSQEDAAGVRTATTWVRAYVSGPKRHLAVWGMVVVGLAWTAILVRHWGVMSLLGTGWHEGAVGTTGLSEHRVALDWLGAMTLAPGVEWLVRPFKRVGRLGIFVGIIFIMASWGGLVAEQGQVFRMCGLVLGGMLLARRVRSVNILGGKVSAAQEKSSKKRV